MAELYACGRKQGSSTAAREESNTCAFGGTATIGRQESGRLPGGNVWRSLGALRLESAPPSPGVKGSQLLIRDVSDTAIDLLSSLRQFFSELA